MSINKNFLKNEKYLMSCLDISNNQTLDKLIEYFDIRSHINFFNVLIYKDVNINLKNLKFEKIYENNAFEKVYLFFDGLYEHILFFQKPYIYEPTTYNLSSNNPNTIFTTSYFNNKKEIIDIIKKRKKFVSSTDKLLRFNNQKINNNSVMPNFDNVELLVLNDNMCKFYDSIFDEIKNYSNEYIINNINNYENIFIENCEKKCEAIRITKLENIESILYIKLFKSFLSCINILLKNYRSNKFTIIPYLDTPQNLLNILENNLDNKNIFFYLENDGYDLKDLINKSIQTNFLYIEEYIQNNLYRKFYKGDVYYGIDRKSLYKHNNFEINL